MAPGNSGQDAALMPPAGPALFRSGRAGTAKTPPGTAGVGCRRTRNLVGAGRAGRGSVMAAAGDRNRKRISALPVALPLAIA
jgi:hypothetical protein